MVRLLCVLYAGHEAEADLCSASRKVASAALGAHLAIGLGAIAHDQGDIGPGLHVVDRRGLALDAPLRDRESLVLDIGRVRRAPR